MARVKFLLAGLVVAIAAPVLAAKPAPPPVVAVPPPVPAPPPPSVRAGVELWRAGDWSGAVAMWQPFANAGDPDAMFNIGQAYKLGRAVPKDAMVARDWYRRAAMKGHRPAQANLGILLFQAGEKAEAVRWLKQAADAGEMRAQYVLGVASWNGDGVPRSLVLAYAYLARASAQGLPEATTALGNLTTIIAPLERAHGWEVATSLAAGKGVPPDFAAGAPARAVPARLPPPAADTAPLVPAFSREQVIKPAPTVVPPPVVAAAPKMPVADDVPPAKTYISGVDPARPPVSPVARPEKPGADTVASGSIPADSPQKPQKILGPTVPAVVAEAAGWRVQLGAFGKKALAEAAWSEIKLKEKQAVAGMKPIFTAAGTVTKLQLGPYPSKAEARDACAKIAFAGRACFVTAR